MVSNPDSPFVEVNIGDLRLDNSPPNQNIQSFDYERSGLDVGSRVNLAVASEDVVEVEEKIIDNRRDVEFRYGWSKGEVSDKYGGRVVDYSTEFYSDSRTAIFNIQIMTDVVEGYTQDRMKTYTKEDGEPMKIHEIVEDIAEYEGWDIGRIEKTLPVIDPELSRRVDEVDEDEIMELQKTFSQDGLSSIKFIKDELLINAVSEEGRGGYHLWFEDVIDNPKIFFAPVSYKGDPVDEYVYKLGARDSRIISFTHHYEGALTLYGGSGTLKSEFVESVTNKLSENVLKDMEIEHAEERMMDLDKRAVKYTNESVATIEEAIGKEKALKTRGQSFAYRAEMQIRGNPNFKIHDMIDVIIYTRKGRYHHTSGRYMIWNVTDTISEGNYITGLELRRDTTKAEVEEKEVD